MATMAINMNDIPREREGERQRASGSTTSIEYALHGFCHNGNCILWKIAICTVCSSLGSTEKLCYERECVCVCMTYSVCAKSGNERRKS